MDIHFAGRTTRWENLYAGVEDLPSLVLVVHLHGWQFADAAGEACFRVEVREGGETRPESLVGSGLVRVTPQALVTWQGGAPLIQAVLDGVFTHDSVRVFFTRLAAETLHSSRTDTGPKPRHTLQAIRGKMG